MTMPVMEPDLDAGLLRAWARAIDDGPFSSLCWGERIAFDNPETLTLLGALAAWTDRVRLVTTVIVPQLHDPVMLAKALATGDMLCSGRLTVGVGVGGRDEDYRAVGADPSTQTRHGLAERVAVMKRVSAGERVGDAASPVGPTPAQPGGPPLLVGTIGPKTLRSASGWADGLAGPHWTSTSPSRMSSSRLGVLRGLQRANRNRIWRRRSGSRWGRPMVPALRCIGICAGT